MLGKALLSASVSAPPAAYVEDVFSTYLYTGNGSTQTITNGIDLAGEGGLVWFKRRDATGNSTLTDTANNGRLFTDLTNALNTNALVSSFNADGFSLNTASTPNQSASNYASWTFRKAPKFFDVVTYTGNGVAGRTVAHNLGSVPGFVIVKRLDSSSTWRCWHRSLPSANNVIHLNETGAYETNSAIWNSTAPTSTHFTVGTNANVNASGGTYVAYLFAHDAGGFGDAGTDSVVSCGSFTTNGSGVATVNLGWEPQWVMIKRASSPLGLFVDSWNIIDNMRGLTVDSAAYLAANSSGAEGGATTVWSITNTGFKYAFGGDASATYIYIAIRRGPMKTPEDATKVFAAQATRAASNGTTSANMFTSNFPIDMYIQGMRSGVNSSQVIDRVRGGSIYFAGTANTNAEFTGYNARFDDMDGVSATTTGGATSDICGWMFRRAPGFFDVVAYTGTGSARTVSHNLGVAPELMIVKRRNSTSGWVVYSFTIGETKGLFLNGTNAEFAASNIWNDTAPTSSVFTVGTSAASNASGQNYIAYLFASCPGVSKVGSYTGTGTTLNIDCGFTAGARFVLIKRTDSTGDWYVWDTARGIIAGNDPYLLLNSTAAEVTNTDYIDPLSSGFQISSTAPAAINASGGSFIYLAVA